MWWMVHHDSPHRYYTDAGCIWSVGEGNYGQLGIDSAAIHTVSTHNQHPDKTHSPEETTIINTKNTTKNTTNSMQRTHALTTNTPQCCFVGGDTQGRALQVAAGLRHSLALIEKQGGEGTMVHAWGGNRMGQCGQVRIVWAGGWVSCVGCVGCVGCVWGS